MTRKTDEVCPCCGAKTVMYTHRMNTGLLGALVQITRKHAKFVHLNELQLSYNQRANFQKLRYWGLVEKNPLVQGEWRSTLSAWKWLTQQERIRSKVVTWRGELRHFAGELVTPKDIDIGFDDKEFYVRTAEPVDNKSSKKWPQLKMNFLPQEPIRNKSIEKKPHYKIRFLPGEPL